MNNQTHDLSALRENSRPDPSDSKKNLY